MKTCSKCKTPKPLSAFNKYNESKDGYQYWCRLCQNQKRKEAWASYYKKNKKRLISKQKIKQAGRRAEVAKLKDKPCADCQKKYPACVMDFDHRGNKKFLISCSGNRNWAKVLKEIKKCDVVCANCHRLRTEKRRNCGRS